MKTFIKVFFALAIVIFLAKIFSNAVSKKDEPVAYDDKSSSYKEQTPAYEQFHVVFKGEPEVQDIQKLMDAILDQYQMEKTELNKHKFGSALLKMQQTSPTGVSEMQIMKYMYQNSDASTPLPTAIGKAAYILEMTN